MSERRTAPQPPLRSTELTPRLRHHGPAAVPAAHLTCGDQCPVLSPALLLCVPRLIIGTVHRPLRRDNRGAAGGRRPLQQAGREAGRRSRARADREVLRCREKYARCSQRSRRGTGLPWQRRSTGCGGSGALEGRRTAAPPPRVTGVRAASPAPVGCPCGAPPARPSTGIGTSRREQHVGR